jgi:hypothetical protein
MKATILIAFMLLSCDFTWAQGRSGSNSTRNLPKPLDQVSSWSQADYNFFLHGSMSTEVVPESVLRAFIQIYPDLFPKDDLSNFGLIPDSQFGWPIGFSRTNVKHLGNLSSIGLNCAGCHVGDVVGPKDQRVRVLGMTSDFYAEAYFGSVIVATFRTAAPTNMARFIGEYFPGSKEQCDAQAKKIAAAVAEDPFGAKGIAAGSLYDITAEEVSPAHYMRANPPDLATFTRAIVKLFHNMRASLHVPDQPPDKAPPASGPGRNDAFGLLSFALFNTPQPYGPVKYGLVWNVAERPWVHWDGNTRSPIGRNLLASLGLGAPLLGKHGQLDFALVKHQTDLSETIKSPRYPFAIDDAAAKRGKAHYQAQCASCHDGKESDARLYAVSDVGTDPVRATAFSPAQAQLFNNFLRNLESPGYEPSKVPGLRSTQKYWAASLPGVWARSPYLHNGSVRTMQELLTSPAQRAKSFHRGSRTYDTEQMGYKDDGQYVLDTTTSGNSNSGHDYGTKLSGDEKKDLIEFLKTL